MAISSNSSYTKSLCIKEVTCKECNGKMKTAWGAESYQGEGVIYYGISSFEKEALVLITTRWQQK